MREFIDVAKALSDEHRVRALLALRDGERCVCQLIELLELAPSTVSKHLSILRQARLVDARKEGRWMYYRLPDKPAPAVRDALALVCNHLSKDPRAKVDAKALTAIARRHAREKCTDTAAIPACKGTRD
jgi:DNA-binding transcriptional ArsR family regulator